MTQTVDAAQARGSARSIAALSLEERRQRSGSTLPGELPADIRDQAASLLRWWERSYFSGQGKLFTRRLRAAGLDRRTVLPLLVAGRAGSAVPGLRSPALLGQMPEPATASGGGQHTGFDAAFETFLSEGWNEVAQALDALEATTPGLTVDTDGVRHHFRAALFERLVLISLQTFTLRMHLARLDGRLSGETSKARFQNWVRTEIGDPGAFRRMLDAYPVMERALEKATAGTGRAWAEMLERLAEHWRSLPVAICGGAVKEDCLVAVKAGLGDTHSGGRTVMRLTFESGSKLVYKPRSLSVDVHAQELLGWLNERGLEPSLRCLWVLDCGDHGWVEMVEPAPCETDDQIRAFYQRQGALLLVLYLLDASDIHSENLIASGEHPVLVDLETLFQAQPVREGSESRSSAGVRENAFHRSALRTLFLPLPSGGTVGFADLGGLRDLDGQLTPNRVMDLVDAATDQMRIVYDRVSFDAAENMPHLGGDVIPAVDHTEDVVAGFTSAYRLALRHRAELSAGDGPLSRFAGDRVRHVLRNTSDYVMLLMSSYHPSCLRDGVRRSFVFDALWLDTVNRSYLERAISSETRELWDGDVPLFTAPVKGRDLTDSRGTVIPDFLQTTGLERVMTRLEGFDEDDLDRQLTAIRGSLAVSGSPPPAPPVTAQPSREASPEEMLDAATKIGERLVRLAVHEGGEAHWTGSIALAKGSIYTVLDPDLYEGTAGIALFLAYLSQATGRRDFEELARAAYRGVANHLRTPDLGPSLGAFGGVPGLQYAALHLSQVWGDANVRADVDDSLDHVGRHVNDDGDYDVHAGAAGGLLVMLRIWESTGLAKALDIARACGRLLLRRAQTFETGLGWPTKEGRKPLLGLAHGGAGIGWALSELAMATGDRRFMRAARKAIAHENARFEPAIGNWPDLRVIVGATSDEPNFMWAWCHGAPGIGIARLRTSVCEGLEDVGADVLPALNSTEKWGFGGVHCLCHGDLGNADFFQLASDALGDPRWRREALWRAHGVLVDAEETGTWRCSGTGLVESPGLMGGLAGVGYGFLRLASPATVPSVLALEGPRLTR